MSPSPTPLQWTGTPQLNQVAQSPIQPHLESLQERGINHVSGQHVSVPHHRHCRRLSPYIQPKSTLLKLEAIFLCPVTTDPPKESVPFFPVSSPLDTERLLSGHFAAFSSPGWTAPTLSACLHGRGVPSLASFWCPSSGCTPTGLCFSFTEEKHSTSAWV